MNSTLDKQADTTEGATVSFSELHGAEGATLPGFNPAQSARILSRLAIERTKANGAKANAEAWAMLDTIGAEIASKLATLRARHAWLDSI